MGALTLSELLDAGIAEAGTPTNRKTVLQTRFLARLRDIYASWPWPFTQKRAADVALAAGVQTLAFGAGSATSDKVYEVKDPIYLYDSAYNSQGLIRTRTLVGGAATLDESANDPATNTGTPTLVKVRSDTGTSYKWSLVFDKVADADYLLAIDYHLIPDDVALGTAPVYPNDDTLIQVVKSLALADRKAEDAQAEGDLAAIKVVNDRSKHGTSPGWNDYAGLDTTVFR